MGHVSEPHLKVWTILLMTILVLYGKVNFTNLSRYGDNISVKLSGLLILLSLSFVLFCFSQPLRFLKNITSIQDAHVYLKELIGRPPYIDFQVHTYHYETRSRIVTESCGDSQTTTRTEFYEDLVPTFRLGQPYEILFWQDVTDLQKLLSPRKIRIVKIKITTLINPIDSKTIEHYDSHWGSFCAEHSGKDKHVDFLVNQGLTGMKTAFLLAFLDLKE